MEKKVRVAVLFGGRSGEHEVSLNSAASVIQAIDRNQYEVIPVWISHEGQWHFGEKAIPAIAGLLEKEVCEQLQTHLPALVSKGSGTLPAFAPHEVDVVFPVLHGTYGEDGTIQGMLEMAQIPYVGAGVLASAVGMDKVLAKKVFEQEGLPQGKYVYFLKSELKKDIQRVIEKVEQELGYPCFVKPANLGSSVGISKAKDREALVEALQLAAQYDRKVIVEEYIPAHEVEVAVLGNDEPQASMPGEIVSSNEFYDYKAKYIDGKSVMRIPAELPEETTGKVRQLAIQAYKAIDCSGLARVDFFIRKDNGRVLINEINTMPGFTPYSMYPKLWEHSGVSYPELISKLIELALQRYEEKSNLKTVFDL
ncbi:D-alanine--D-alanine ligase [Thermoactinomyces intermedius]|jgi:D-alanine-D-alanine ligase|uniref:D-alanine--D-alanine ligase n=1 Tax=Thermoactinomyces intermedius TaxID=2024 RepID=A0A8I1A4A9_THEIN|nr:D-alanine--D-alanine ligase [Thermoactinomyces intermedius]MBA4548681.1 D-alanine--D-alanine ligase [Thermoactinomyces intermedius]MBA4836755.1 D-alanine--D-alanine ligase [Thermoactinomyces intermedius]MBH8594559.1 D-alanine--D-alanine ligase [Thermoactinomyces intermedius]